MEKKILVDAEDILWAAEDAFERLSVVCEDEEVKELLKAVDVKKTTIEIHAAKVAVQNRLKEHNIEHMSIELLFSVAATLEKKGDNFELTCTDGVMTLKYFDENNVEKELKTRR